MIWLSAPPTTLPPETVPPTAPWGTLSSVASDPSIAFAVGAVVFLLTVIALALVVRR